MKMLKIYCCLFLKALVTVQGLLRDGDLPYTSADGVFWLPLTFVGLGQEDK